MQDPGSATEILVWAQNILGLITVSLGCSGERSVPPLSLLLPAAAEGRGPWGSQLAGADSRFQFVGQGSEDLVKLLIAPGLVAAGALAAPEKAHLELGAEHLEQLWPGLEPCKTGCRGQGLSPSLERPVAPGPCSQGTSPQPHQQSSKVY